MSRWFKLAASLVVASGIAQPASADPMVLVVGTPHLASAGNHVVNVQVPDVLTPERQREIDAVVNRLATFRPTHVAVEWDAHEQAPLDKRYADFRAGRYRLTANEVDQIGLRLAARLNLDRVHAVDWGEEPPGGWSRYNYPVWADANGRGDEWRAWVARQQEEANAAMRLMGCTPVSAWLRRFNSPEYRTSDHRAYYKIAQVGHHIGENPGAAWVGSWYTRNLRILNNLRMIAPNPQDRVAVIYGAGHGYLLDQQARESGHFAVADTMSYLPASPRDDWARCPG